MLIHGLAALLMIPVGTPGWFWTVPQCDTVYGDGGVTFSADDGAVLAPTKQKLQRVTYAKVATLAEPNVLVAIGRRSIQRSADAGCSWQQIDKSPDDLASYDVTAGPGRTAYVHSVNDQPIHRVDGTRVSTVQGPTPGNGIAALHAGQGVLKVVAGDGQVFGSTDDGVTWQPQGTTPARDLYVYDAVIDPTNPAHIVAGVMSDGVYTTFDGGRTWTHAAPVERVNAFSLAISPANPQRVWMEGYDRDRSTRFLWQSDDGGRKFREVLDESRATLYNGNRMWPSPVDPDLLYFAYGTSFANYGSDLYRFRPSTGELSKQHNDHDGIPGLAFNPADPSVLYLGLAEER